MKKISVLLFLLMAVGVFAQNKQLTIEDCILKRGTTFNPRNIQNLAWVPNTHTVAYRVEDATNGDYIALYDFKTKSQQNITLQDINLALANFQAVFGAPGKRNDKLKSLPHSLSWQNQNEMLIFSGDSYYLYNYTQKSMRVLNMVPADAQNTDKHIGGNIAYTINNNLYIKPNNGNAFAVTNDTVEGVVNGQSVHRNEFGITKGTFWNSDGTKLAYYRMDESMVSQVTYYNYGNYPGGNTPFRYPMAGQKSHHVTIGVFDAVKGKTIFLETGEPLEQYLTNVTWSADDKYIYVATVMRDQAQMYLKRYDAVTGKLDQILFEEKNDRWVEPENGPMFLPDDKNKFIWQSERDGYNHLYLYNTDGKLIRQLTKGNWIVTELLGIDAKGKYAYFTATKRSALDNTVYSVKLSNGEVTELAGQSGKHFVQFSTDYAYFIDNHSSHQVPRNISIKNGSNGKTEYEMLNAPNPLADYQLGETSVFTIKSTDGTTDLYARMIKPVNFDPNKKYPVVVYVYGGPHLQLISNAFLNSADLWMNYMAQQGFVVFSLDNRGSANRGFEFESAIHRRVGTVEIEDQLAGVNYLKQQTFVDSSRMAVFGWSFGGFMTTSLMTRTPGTFKVGIAGGPVIDWRMYEIMYTERYMDMPIENPEGYENNSLLNYIQNLQGKLLMIHGTSDDVVVWQHSLEYVKKAVSLGKQMDYFVYPAHPHNVRGKDRVHLYQKVTDYIMDNINK